MKPWSVVMCALALVFAGCSNSGGNAGSSSATAAASSAEAAASAAAGSNAAGSKKIGVSIQNREAQFYQDMESGMRSEAAKYGYSVTFVDASRDNSKQQSQVEDF